MTQNCINGTFTYLLYGFGVTLLIIRILAPKMEKWGQDPNNEQCIYTLLIIRILAPNLFLRYWGQDPNNEQCLYNIAHYQDTCPSFLKNDNFLVSNFNQQVAECKRQTVPSENNMVENGNFYLKRLLPFSAAPEFC